MVKSYCVKEKRQTDCVPGSETTVRAKNGRLMMKCKCASCGITRLNSKRETNWALSSTSTHLFVEHTLPYMLRRVQK